MKEHIQERELTIYTHLTITHHYQGSIKLLGNF